MTRPTVALFIAVALSVTCTPSEAQRPAAETAKPKPASTQAAQQVGERIREVWYTFTFAGSKIGFVKAIDERTAINGRPALHANRWSVLTVKRETDTVKITSKIDSWFAPDGTPMRFLHERTEGAEKRSIEGYRDGAEFVVRHSIGKNLSEKRFPLTKDLKIASSLELLVADHLKVGTKLKGRLVDETQGDVQPYTVDVLRKRPDGSFDVRQVVGPITADIRIAADGTILEVLLPDMGVQQKRVTKAEALEQGEALDLFSAALFAMPNPLPARHDMDALILRLSSKQGRKLSAITDGRQKAKPSGGAVELTIRVQDAPASTPQRPLKTKRAFLASTEYEPLDDEALKAVARKVTAGRASVWDAARSINAFVFRHIENKSLARAYASAPEALATREGDCTEHAVLFSALAKIAGIPTRLVTGLVYVGGPKNVFGYHAWVEIWTGQEWLAMDPTFGQDVADATHVKLYAGQSDAEGLRASSKAAASAVGDLDIAVIAYIDTAGKRHTL